LVSIRTLLRFVIGSVAIVSVRSALGLVVCARVFSAINDEFPDTVTSNFAAAKANVFGVFKVPVVSLHLHLAPWLDDNGVEIVRSVHPALMFIPRSLEAKPPAIVRLSQDIKVVAPITVLLGGPIAAEAIHLSTILTAVAPCLAFFIRVIVVNVMRFASRRVAKELVMRPIHCRKETVGALPRLVFGAPAVVSVRSALGVVRLAHPEAKEAIPAALGVCVILGSATAVILVAATVVCVGGMFYNVIFAAVCPVVSTGIDRGAVARGFIRVLEQDNDRVAAVVIILAPCRNIGGHGVVPVKVDACIVALA
jgi:hypothetical protein